VTDGIADAEGPGDRVVGKVSELFVVVEAPDGILAPPLGMAE
jgi:hypothetical protein